ncbi:MAG: hypothetical protein KIT60_18105 [Burkholderiaceae bacterium]|nr:hypothetical protein [Burkholderiaceae bacterium]
MRITSAVCASALVLSSLLGACGQRDSATGTSPSGATGTSPSGGTGTAPSGGTGTSPSGGTGAGTATTPPTPSASAASR